MSAEFVFKAVAVYAIGRFVLPSLMSGAASCLGYLAGFVAGERE